MNDETPEISDHKMGSSTTLISDFCADENFINFCWGRLVFDPSTFTSFSLFTISL